MRTLKLSTAFAVILWLATQAAFAVATTFKATTYAVTIKNVTGVSGAPPYTLVIKGIGGNGMCISDFRPIDEDVSISPGQSTQVSLTTADTSSDCEDGTQIPWKTWPIEIKNAKNKVVETGTLRIGATGLFRLYPVFKDMKHYAAWFLLTCTDAYNCEFTYKNATPD